VEIPALPAIEEPKAGSLRLSQKVVKIITQAIRDAAQTKSFEEALEVGYSAFGDVSCTDAAWEGISAFMEKRLPRFEK
jgi:enoyl-CoA hydratase/3-hydroxyacyl-CoA dehydrogenase